MTLLNYSKDVGTNSYEGEEILKGVAYTDFSTKAHISFDYPDLGMLRKALLNLFTVNCNSFH